MKPLSKKTKAAAPIRKECAWCNAESGKPSAEDVSHGICPACAKKHFPEVARP